MRRSLKAVYGELGEVDPAAAFEAGRGRKFVYQLFDGGSCLVELDESPPREMNQQALEAAIEIALLLGARVLDEVHTMRKTVIDGSSPTAFQRTALVAVNGKLKTSFGGVGIPTVCVEEESAGIVEREAGEVTYRLDRLGIPLVEIATDASISSGAQAREVAEKIGLLLRNAGRVQRGIGSIRQDVNVSIEGGARVEVKGVQELNQLSRIVEIEARRQAKLIEIKRELEKRLGARSGWKKLLVKNVSKIFSNTDCKLIKKAITQGSEVVGVLLPGFAGVLGVELTPGHRMGKELSDYAKAKTGVSGLIHSGEELGKYGISREEAHNVGWALECGGGDGWAICVAEEAIAKKSLEAALERAVYAVEAGVPKETRRAEGETTVFMRPLPGSARMYPETDVPPVRVSNALVQRITAGLPESFEEKITRLVDGRGLGRQLAEAVVKSGRLQEFEGLLEKTGAEPVLVATTLLQTLVALSREGVEVQKISVEELEKSLSGVARGEIVKAALPAVLRGIAGGKDFHRVVREGKFEKISGRRLAKIIGELKGSGRVFEEIMREHRLNLDPTELNELLKSFKQKKR